MVTTYAKIMGSIFLLLGILGFIPATAPDNMLLGIFLVDTFHSIVHIVSGFILLAVGLSENYDLTRRVTMAFAILYGFLAVIGFFTPEGRLVMGMQVNQAGNVLHLAIAVSALMAALPRRYPSIR